MTMIVPFLLLGIGVDDIFVIVQGSAAGLDLETWIISTTLISLIHYKYSIRIISATLISLIQY